MSARSFSFVVLHRDTSGPVEVLSVESVSLRRPPDVVRALLSILELEGPLLTTVGAQLWTRAVQLPLDLQLQSVESHCTQRGRKKDGEKANLETERLSKSDLSGIKYYLHHLHRNSFNKHCFLEPDSIFEAGVVIRFCVWIHSFCKCGDQNLLHNGDQII